jgi:hypothetical protein
VDVGGRDEREKRRPVFRDESRKRKKEEFPGLMENMLPGNSFPQICVVSVNESVKKLDPAQGHKRIVAKGNLDILLIGNWAPRPELPSFRRPALQGPVTRS